MSQGAKQEPRNVQRNVEMNLHLDNESHAGMSHLAGATFSVSNHSEAAPEGRLCEANRGTKPQKLVQTNVSCAYWPFNATASGFSHSSLRQQSNLESKLQRSGLESVVCVGHPHPLASPDRAPSRSCPGKAGSKTNNFSDRSPCWSRKPAERFGLHGLPHFHCDLPERRREIKDQCTLKQPLGCVSVSERSCGNLRAHGDSFSPPKLSMLASSGSLSSVPSPSKKVDISASGPALTLDHLSSSTLVESDPSSMVLQALLQSSQMSAELHRSIQRLKEEAAALGTLGSFPWETKSPPFSHQSPFDPWVSAAATLSFMGESSAKQTSMKWQTPFVKHRGLSSTAAALQDAGPLSFYYRSKNAQVDAPPTDTLSQGWATAFSGGVSPTTLGAEKGYSDASLCYLCCCSGVQKVLEEKGTRGPLNALYHQGGLDPEELSCRSLHCSELTHESLPSFDGLKVSLETLCAGTPVNMGVALYGPQSDVLVTVGSPRSPGFIPTHRFDVGSELSNLCGPRGDSIDASGPSVITDPQEHSTPFPPPKSCPFGVVGRKGLSEYSQAAAGVTDGKGTTAAGESSSGSQNSLFVDRCGLFVEEDQSKVSFTGKTAELPHLAERHHVASVMPEEEPKEDGSTDGDRSRPVLQKGYWLLRKYFRLWHDHVFGKEAAAQVLYRQQLLRKGLGALKWAVQLRDTRLGDTQRRRTRALLAASFRRWREATAKLRKERASPKEAASHTTDFPALLERERIPKAPVFCQLPAELLKEAAQYSRAEGNLWIQHHLTPGASKLCGEIQAVRDVRRLAAAFRLWCLQKERLDREGARAQEVRAILEKKRLRAVFERWHSRSCANQQILPLVARIQRRLISCFFSAWKGFAERKVLSRRALEIQRARSLRMHFLQWSLMVQLQETARKTVLELLTLRQRKSCDVPMTQPCPIVARWSPRNGAKTLEGLYHALKLQAAFWAWRERWRTCERANTFCRTVVQRQQRETLHYWRQRALRANSLRPRSQDLTKEAVLPLLVSEESSLSSGFYSQTAALLTSGSYLGKENSLGSSSSRSSISSLEIVEDTGLLPQPDLPSARRVPDPDVCVDASVASCVQACPRRNCCAGEDRFVRDQFQPLGSFSADCGASSFAAFSAWEELSGGTQAENPRQLLAKCFALWSARTQLNLKAKLHHRRALQSWALTTWSMATAHASTWLKALVHFEGLRMRCLLLSCFERWKVAFLRAEQQRKEDSLRWRRVGRGAMQRWRKAARSYRPLHLNSVKEACNYWTNAAAFHQCCRQRSSLIATRKFAKLPLSWTAKPRRNREKLLPSSLAGRSRLIQSSCRTWQAIYRCQSRSLWPSRDKLDTTGQRAKEDGIQGGGPEVVTDDRRHLGRKYLRLWRHKVLLHRFWDACRTRILARAWLSWKGAWQTELVVQTLARQRRLEWAWNWWRRRSLQSWVAERFSEAQDRRLLEEAFRKWQQQVAS